MLLKTSLVFMIIINRKNHEIEYHFDVYQNNCYTVHLFWTILYRFVNYFIQQNVILYSFVMKIILEPFETN